MAQLVVEKLCKAYPTRSESLVVLQSVTLHMEGGESLAVIGPSGVGKSTLLHILGTLERPTSGSVRVDGIDPFQLPARDLAAFRQRQVGFIFQDHHLLPQFTVLENILVPALAAGRTSRADGARAHQLMDRVGLAERRDHRPSELSGGERQRVAIARSLMMQPSLLLADEPTGNLDRATAQAIAELLLELQQGHGHPAPLLVVVTHSPELAARMTRQATLEQGQLVEAAT